MILFLQYTDLLCDCVTNKHGNNVPTDTVKTKNENWNASQREAPSSQLSVHSSSQLTAGNFYFFIFAGFLIFHFGFLFEKDEGVLIELLALSTLEDH